MQIRQKVSWGFYLIIGISTLLILKGCCLSDHCDSSLYNVDLSYINKSKVSISIQHFSRVNRTINSDVMKNLILAKDEMLTFYSANNFESSTVPDLEYFKDYHTRQRLYDSAVVIFNNEKFLVHSKGEVNTEIFDIDNYEFSQLSENSFLFVYEFTEADYARAEDLN